ncbi:Proteasome endopeptidase complex [Meloidogyne graminicola]|uniref:Proteasome endopeptidase complex n=1 Tax=Meloidogyne graminicola TaxID=189291 RepID=A0A8T0A2D1_9BILA|nr:Proteasome endopeptidase complex [Meloidogyne graminicola]
MFRNQYDSDVTVFSPQGRLHQNDYAIEAMRQGSATVALHGKDHAVVVALMRSQNELSSYQSKIFELDSHVGLSMSGLLADGRILARFIQNECITFFSELQTLIPMENLRSKLTMRMQGNLQNYGRRPFGVGLLIIGYDHSGPHVLNADPSANVFSVKAASIGSRSQSARTYLEKHLEEYENSIDQNVVIRHALLALKETLPANVNLDEMNTAVAIVGKRCKFQCLSSDRVSEAIANLRDRGPFADEQEMQH